MKARYDPLGSNTKRRLVGLPSDSGPPKRKPALKFPCEAPDVSVVTQPKLRIQPNQPLITGPLGNGTVGNHKPDSDTDKTGINWRPEPDGD